VVASREGKLPERRKKRENPMSFSGNGDKTYPYALTHGLKGKESEKKGRLGEYIPHREELAVKICAST